MKFGAFMNDTEGRIAQNQEGNVKLERDNCEAEYKRTGSYKAGGFCRVSVENIISPSC
jgi:hypothetical protein